MSVVHLREKRKSSFNDMSFRGSDREDPRTPEPISSRFVVSSIPSDSLLPPVGPLSPLKPGPPPPTRPPPPPPRPPPKTAGVPGTRDHQSPLEGFWTYDTAESGMQTKRNDVFRPCAEPGSAMRSPSIIRPCSRRNGHHSQAVRPRDSLTLKTTRSDVEDSQNVEFPHPRSILTMTDIHRPESTYISCGWYTDSSDEDTTCSDCTPSYQCSRCVRTLSCSPSPLHSRSLSHSSTPSTVTNDDDQEEEAQKKYKAAFESDLMHADDRETKRDHMKLITLRCELEMHLTCLKALKLRSKKLAELWPPMEQEREIERFRPPLTRYRADMLEMMEEIKEIRAEIEECEAES